MADPYMGEIHMFAGNFAPQNFAFCDGSLISIAQNDALYSLLGTTYGGDGVNTFGLPDFRGRVPVHAGQGNGLSYYVQGQVGGSETVQLTTYQTGAHSHAFAVASGTANLAVGGGSTLLANENAGPAAQKVFTYAPASGNQAALNAATVATAGGNGLPHDNLQPFLAVNFIIAIDGVYPTHP